MLSVLFNTLTAATAQASQFTQGNGGDDAFFQVNTAILGGFFNYLGGSGGNYVQADSNAAAGVFDGGSKVPSNVLGQDNNNLALIFVDFGNNVIIA